MPFAAGQKLRASELRSPVCVVKRITAQSITNAIWTDMSWNSEVVDTHGMWAAGAPTDLVFRRTGYYLVSVSIGFDAIGTGQSRGVRISVGGAIVDGGEVVMNPSPSGRMSVPMQSMILSVTNGNVLKIAAFQDTGAALNTSPALPYAPQVSIAFQGD